MDTRTLVDERSIGRTAGPSYTYGPLLQSTVAHPSLHTRVSHPIINYGAFFGYVYRNR